jgi:hypothetical protein
MCLKMVTSKKYVRLYFGPVTVPVPASYLGHKKQFNKNYSIARIIKGSVAHCHSFELFLHLSSRHTMLIYTTHREPLFIYYKAKIVKFYEIYCKCE